MQVRISYIALSCLTVEVVKLTDNCIHLPWRSTERLRLCCCCGGRGGGAGGSSKPS